MQPSSNPEYYGDMHGYPGSEDDENSVAYQGYVTDGMSIDRRRALFSPITGVQVPDEGEAFNHPYLYIPPTVQSIRPIAGHQALLSPVTNPDISVQLDPENSPLLNQEPQALSMQPSTLASDLFMTPPSGSFIDPILSPLSDDAQAFAHLVIPEYQYPEASTHMPVSATDPPSTSSILPYPSAGVIIPNTGNNDPGTSGTTSSDNITDASLPIVRLPFGVWKCVICGVKLRRKHRAVVHFWNKHGGMRLHCQGRCGLPECNKSFASQDGLDVHLNPVLVECSSCGKTLLKKNIIRHRDLHCPVGEVVS